VEDKPGTADKVEIVEFRAKYRAAFREINREWLEKYFVVEPYDKIVLDDPQGQIIQRGGVVLFAKLGKDIVGACALLKHTEQKYELAKMGVLDNYHGRGIGRKLIEQAIDRARALGADILVLATSPKLEAANRLYEKVGFQPADFDEIGPLPYARHTIVLSMDLTTAPA